MNAMRPGIGMALCVSLLWAQSTLARSPQDRVAAGEKPSKASAAELPGEAPQPEAETRESKPSPASTPEHAKATAHAKGTTHAKGTAGKGMAGKGMARLDPKAEVWVDAKRKRVIVGGQICLRKGFLEMFACPRGTKEHESVVSVNTRAYMVHAGLLAVGAKSGQPVQYDPAYRAASGDTIDVHVLWRNEAGKVVRRRAQDMVRQVKTRRPMDHNWVFAGSGFWEDDGTGERFYQAEGGELICLSNFSTATLDLNVESPRDNAELLYEAMTENIPELGTKIRLVLSVAKAKQAVEK